MDSGPQEHSLIGVTRYIETATGDLIWIYNLEIGEANPLKGDDQALIAAWIQQNVYKNTKHKFSPKPRVAFGDPKGDTLQITGVVGTSIVLASGYQVVPGPPAPFVPFSLPSGLTTLFLEKIAADGPGYVPDVQYVPSAQSTSYWTDMDARLAGQPDWHGGIDVYILEGEKQVYVHIELGADLTFAYQYFGYLNSDFDGFRDWLLSGHIVSRNIYKVVPGSNIPELLEHVPPINIRLDINPIFPPKKTFFDAPPLCRPGCHMDGVCSIVAGTLTSFDPGTAALSGYATFNVEIVALKPYCVDNVTGDPCEG